MNITDVKMRHVNTKDKIKAIVSVTFEDAFVIHDIKVIDGEKGSFVAMPSRRISEGKYRDIAHPINSEMRSKIEDAVFESFNAYVSDSETLLDEERFDKNIGSY